MKHDTHTDETRVREYTLPDPLRRNTGAIVRSAADWPPRREEILEAFREHVYGRVPAFAYETRVTAEERFALEDHPATATQRRVEIRSDHGSIGLDLLDVLPTDTDNDGTAGSARIHERPEGHRASCPVILALNFSGNHAVLDDRRVWLSRAWIDSFLPGVVDNRATEAGRGAGRDRWPIDMIVGAGFGVATVACGDLDPDFDDGFANGVHGLAGLPPTAQRRDKPGSSGITSDSGRPPDAWGTIAGWAWGLSRILDVLLADPRIDPDRIIVLGHSRMGKTALWAAAQDERFAGAISNESGCGGAALTRREFGETIGAITSKFPHWFCPRFAEYAARADALPVDQHMLLGLLAPRPLYVASAADDLWADPKGEYLSVYHAAPVYRLFGYGTVTVPEPPPVGTHVGNRISYHCRSGGHDITRFDWERYLRFLRRELEVTR